MSTFASVSGDSQRVILNGLNTKEYEHSLDKIALDALKKIPILPKLTELVVTPLSMITRYSLLGSDLRITDRQFPSLYKIFRQACDVLEVPEPLLYVSSQPELNAYTTCPDKPIIRIYSYLLDILEDDEIMFVLGHELTHIKCQHVVHRILGEMLETGALKVIVSTVPGLGMLYSPVEISLNYAFYQWMRASEYTGDRGGFLACQNFDASCRALMKLSGYSRKYANEINLDEFFAQAQTFQDENEAALGKIQQILLSYGQDHPWGVLRVRELMKFKNDGSYDKILRREMKLPEPSHPASPEAAPLSLSSVSSALSNVKFSNPFKKQ